MKNQLKGFILGILVTLLLVGSIGTAAATVGSQTAELHYNNITVTLDSALVNLRTPTATQWSPSSSTGPLTCRSAPSPTPSA